MGSDARLALRIAPGARRTEVVGRHGDRWKVRVAAPPERGRANEALLRYLAETLGVDGGRLRIVAGAASRDKVVQVVGLTADEADRLLERRQTKGVP